MSLEPDQKTLRIVAWLSIACAAICCGIFLIFVWFISSMIDDALWTKKLYASLLLVLVFLLPALLLLINAFIIKKILNKKQSDGIY